MGFKLDDAPAPVQPIWLQYRDQFPVTRQLVYLNHASVAPLCLAASEAMKRLADDASSFGALHYDGWLEAYERLRSGAATLLGAHRDEIALVKNTSEGIATVALGIDWHSGDKIVAFKEEFPANYLPWQRLTSKGVQIEWLHYTDPLERIETACRGARLLAISFVQYISGFRANVNAIGEICRRLGVFFFVDAIQGLGAFPLNVETAKIDALAADGHKWMLGPEGCGILYVRRERLDEIEPVEFGWTNVANYNDYSEHNTALRPDAGRYECGTLNTIGCFGLSASIHFLLDVGIENIAPAVRSLSAQIAEGVAARGYEILGARTPESASGIVSFRKPGLDSPAVVARLLERGIAAAARRGWIRASPHFYIGPEDIAQLLEALP